MEYMNEKLKEFNQYLKNRKVAVIGLGISNIPLVEYLHMVGANITIFDRREKEKIPEEGLKKILDYELNYHFGPTNLEYLTGFDIIFRSPSCRPDLPEIVAELEKGAILTSEIEMVLELCPGTVVGVTGSDGKTTTTTLIYEMLRKQGFHCFLGGNIGNPLLSKIPEMKPDDMVVLELSSFQLMNMKISPDIAVVTNVSPNHLDIHKSYEEYIDSKKNIFKHQTENGILVLNYDNEITKSFVKEANGKVIFFSKNEKLDNGIILEDGDIKICEDKLRRHLINTKDMKLRGEHNYENACAAVAATKSFVSVESQVEVLKEFSGVEHRIEFIREIDGVKWYNDSIGTSPTRTMAGLKSFDEEIVLIAGGYDKHLDYTPLAKPIVDKVKTLILVGQTSEKIYEAVKQELEKQNKTIDIYMCDQFSEIVPLARKKAEPGQVILFSPASASFDLFKNFEERGEKFKELVNQLD